MIRNKFEELQNEIFEVVKKAIDKNGVESKFSDTKVLKVSDDFQWYLGRGRLYEITDSYLIDSSGYQYSYSTLDFEVLINLVEHIEKENLE